VSAFRALLHSAKAILDHVKLEVEMYKYSEYRFSQFTPFILTKLILVLQKRAIAKNGGIVVTQ
jgi:hypothetical protein